jgi:hypothetical protein
MNMFKMISRKISSHVASDTKMIALAAIIVSMACLAPVSIPHQKAYSQSNNHYTSPLEQYPQFFEVPVPDSDEKGFFYVYGLPDDWTKVQQDPYIDSVQTASASAFCPSQGCGEASLQLFAYLSTPGSFFPTGATAQPQEVFQGIIDYNEGTGMHATQVLPLDGSDPAVIVQVEAMDDQGQKMRGLSNYILSEQLGVLWEISYLSKDANWDYYFPIFQQIKDTIQVLYPTDPYVICHENQTSECLAMVSDMINDNTNTMNQIIANMQPGCTFTEHLERKC